MMDLMEHDDAAGRGECPKDCQLCQDRQRIEAERAEEAQARATRRKTTKLAREVTDGDKLKGIGRTTLPMDRRKS